MAEPSPEVKAIVKEWCEMQRTKYGPNWKRILAAEMAAETKPALRAILELHK